MKHTLNVLPVQIRDHNLTIYVTENPTNERLLLSKSGDSSYFFWQLNPSDQSREKSVSLDEPLAPKFLTGILFLYFASRHIVSFTFINDVEVWRPTNIEQDWDIYERFALRIEKPSLIGTWGIRVTYEGRSCILKTPYGRLGEEKARVSKVLHGNRIITKRDSIPFPDDAQPLLNRYLAQELSLHYPLMGYYRQRNPYRYYFDRIQAFANDELRGRTIAERLVIASAPFVSIGEDRVDHIPFAKNLLEFAESHKNYSIIDGLRKCGPFQVPRELTKRFFFMFKDTDRDVANKLHRYLKKGYRSYPGLEGFVGIRYELDESATIRFPSFDIAPQMVQQWLQHYQEDPDLFAIVITPTTREIDRAENKDIYPRLKQILLAHNISSQFVEQENIGKYEFNFYLTNISLAILAKLGGIPWRIPFPDRQDLVVGFGVHRGQGDMLIGNTVCFDNYGVFRRFDAHNGQDIVEFADFLEAQISTYSNEIGPCERVIIHYFKRPGTHDRALLEKVKSRIQTPIPYIFITINESASRDYVFFDEDFDEKLPVSGSYVRLRPSLYLLCSNPRYKEATRQKIDQFPFPVKIYIQPGPGLTIDGVTELNLIQQVFEFSRLYWRSVRQHNLPVTVQYSKLLAQQVSDFPDQKLPSTLTAKETPWFL